MLNLMLEFKFIVHFFRMVGFERLVNQALYVKFFSNGFMMPFGPALLKP